MGKEEFDKLVASLTPEEIKFLDEFGRVEVPRTLLGSNEIKQCNLLVKKGVMCKGKCDDASARNRRLVMYYVESFVWSRIN